MAAFTTDTSQFNATISATIPVSHAMTEPEHYLPLTSLKLASKHQSMASNRTVINVMGLEFRWVAEGWQRPREGRVAGLSEGCVQPYTRPLIQPGRGFTRGESLLFLSHTPLGITNYGSWVWATLDNQTCYSCIYPNKEKSIS